MYTTTVGQLTVSARLEPLAGPVAGGR